MSTEIAKEEAASPNALVYKVTPEQIGNALRRGINRRRVEVFKVAELNRRRAKNAAKRLEADLRRTASPDRSLVGLCRKLQRIGSTRIVGKDWRKPRPGRRL